MSFYSSGAYDQDKDPEYVYYNALIIDNRTGLTSQSQDPPVKFQETRSVPIIGDSSKYAFSIVRANLNGPNLYLPMFIPTIASGIANISNNINLTIYTVTMKITYRYVVASVVYNFDTEATASIIWEPENTAPVIAEPPIPPVAAGTLTQDLGNQYYWCYTYSHWLGLTNKALTAARDACNVAFRANYISPTGWNLPGPAPQTSTQPPKIQYNPDDYKFSLYADSYGFGDPIPGGPNVNFGVGGVGSTATSYGTNAQEAAELWFNDNTFGMYANFPANYQNLSLNKQWRLLVYPILFNNVFTVALPAAFQPPIPPTIATISYYVMIQDYPSTSTLWSPIESIVFTSTMLPLVFEQVGAPVTLGDGNNTQQLGSDANFQPIITDISLTNTTSHDYKSFIQYLPTAEYRMTSLQRSKVAVGNIDIQIFWKNRLDGKLYPLFLYNGSSVSLKCMFRRLDAPSVIS